MRRVDAEGVVALFAVAVLLAVELTLLLALASWTADTPCPAGQHRVLVPGGHRCDSGVVVRGETP